MDFNKPEIALQGAEPSSATANSVDPSKLSALRRLLGVIDMLTQALNKVIVFTSTIAIASAGAILSWEATARYLFKIPSDWQDEVTIFLLVGATFMSCAWVQLSRGHIGIQALSGLLSPRVDWIRRILSDLMSALFCTFFSWKSWTLLLEAIEDHQISDSAFGAPLWIPYSSMAVGMSLLTLVLFTQVLSTCILVSSVPSDADQQTNSHH
jgi:TRAP-type C4-dicarboxylate transport system permease small subunit